MSSPNRPAFSTTAAMMVCVAALVAAVALGTAAAGDSVLPGDVRITSAIQDLNGPLFMTLAEIGNAFGSAVGAGVAVVLAVLVAARLRSWPDAAFFGALFLLRLAATQLKPMFESPRPTADLVLITGFNHGSGYPSGHSLTASTLALGLAVLAWRHIPSRRFAVVAVVLLIGLGLLTGWARIWTGAHWPSDVLGGFAFGAAIVAAGVAVLDRVSRAQPPSRRRRASTTDQARVMR